MEPMGHEIDNLIRVSWILLVPVGVLLAIVLFKLAFLLHGVSEFLSIARYELYPALKDLRLVASNAEVLTSKAVAGAETLEKGMTAAGRGVSGIKSVSEGVVGGLGSLAGSFLKGLVGRK